MSPVRNAVCSAVDELSTVSARSVVHMFAACHPLRAAQVTRGDMWSDSTVSASSYEAIHTVHRTYFLYS